MPGQWAEVLVNLDQIIAVQNIRHEAQQVTGHFVITEDPVEFVDSGEKPYYTCQRITEPTKHNLEGQPIQRALAGQFFLAQLVLDHNRVAARRILEIARDIRTGKKVLLVEVPYAESSVPSKFFREKIIHWVAQDDLISYVVFADATPGNKVIEHVVEIETLPTSGPIYRDTFHKKRKWLAVDVRKYRQLMDSISQP
jgi:hypothetical protein